MPILSAGRQLDLEWEMRRKDGSTFRCRLIAKAIDAARKEYFAMAIDLDRSLNVEQRARAAERLARYAEDFRALSRVRK